MYDYSWRKLCKARNDDSRLIRFSPAFSLLDFIVPGSPATEEMHTIKRDDLKWIPYLNN
jgi:hypothetical protein